MREIRDSELIIDFDQERMDIDEFKFIIKDARFNGYKTVRLSIEDDAITQDNEEGTIEYFHTAKLIFTK